MIDLKKIQYVLIGLMLLSGIGCDSSEQQTIATAEDTISFSLDAKLAQVMTYHQLMGMSVVVVCENEVRYQGHFGMANTERNIPIAENTAYRIASISKAVAAAAALLLVEEGKASLDADVNEYLDFSLRNPKFPNMPITLRMLLNHTSSLVDAANYSEFAANMFAEPLHLKELLTPKGRYYQPELYLDKQPGSYFTYSNVAWGVVGTIVERLSGQTFQAFCQERLFTPLQMNASFDPATLPPNVALATLYRANANRWIPQKDDTLATTPIAETYEIGTNALVHAPQGGLRASASDLANFMRMLMNHGMFEGVQVLQPTTVEQMLVSHWQYDGNNGNTSYDLFFSWGLGIHRLTNQPRADIALSDYTLVGHPGEAYGLISDLYFDPERNMGFVFLTNGSRNRFSAGEHSSFYSTEEAVFEAIASFLKQECGSN